MEKLTIDTFKEKIFDFEKNETVLKGTIPMIIDFYADWCGPCRAISPILEELNKEYEGKVNIYKINVDEEPILSRHFNIRNIPAVIFMPVDTPDFTLSIGAKPKSAYIKMIEDLFSISNTKPASFDTISVK